jgi:TatD DNase family protein
MIEREPSEVIDEALRKGVIKIISIGIDLESSRKNSYYASQFKNVYTAMGFHPHESKKMNDEYFVQLEKLLSTPKNIALGEIGLDYYYLHSSKEEQKRAFREQIDLARRYNLPIIVHDRDAHEDTMKILEEKAKNMKVVLHCFSGDKNMAEWCVQRGYYFGIGGVITFKNARKLAEIVREIPLENILLETDSPFLTPMPFRGKPNEPKYIPIIAEKIAELKEKEISEIGNVTTENANQFFGF